MANYIDPYLITLLGRASENDSVEFLVIWQEWVDFHSRNRRIEENHEIITSLIAGKIVHCRATPDEIWRLFSDEDIEILHATFPPTLF